MDNLEQALLESENSLMLLSDEELITPINDILIINPETRLIEVPSTELLLGVFGENLVEKKYFKCPRIILNNIDLYECFIFINYISANGRIGYIQSENVELDETEQYILFDWDLTNNVFDKNKDSTIYFSVSAKQYLEDSEPVFATRKAQGKMYETINGTEYITQEHADIILQILAGMKTKVDLPKDEDGNLIVPEEGQTLLFKEDGTTYYGTPSSGGGTSFSGSAKDVTYDDTETKLGAENVQDAIGKLSEDITIEVEYDFLLLHESDGVNSSYLDVGVDVEVGDVLKCVTPRVDGKNLDDRIDIYTSVDGVDKYQSLEFPIIKDVFGETPITEVELIVEITEEVTSIRVHENTTVYKREEITIGKKVSSIETELIKVQKEKVDKKDIPTKTSQLTDDVGFAKQLDVDKLSEEIDNYMGTESVVREAIPMVTFVDDDGHKDVLTKLKPLSQTYGIPFVCAVPSDFVDSSKTSYMNLSDLKTLESMGWEISSHTKSHCKLGDLSELEQEAEIGGSKEAFDSMGLNVQTICYPYSSVTENTYKIAKRYFKCGRLTNYKELINITPLETWDMRVTPLGSYFESNTSSGLDTSTLEYYKYMVDRAVSENGWVIFMTHCNEHDATQQGYLEQVVQYVQSLDIPVVTLSEGLKKRGNIVDSGRYNRQTLYTSEYFVVGCDSKVRQSDNDKYVVKLDDNSVVSSTPITAFPPYAISYCRITGGSHGFPLSNRGGGTLITNTMGFNIYYYPEQRAWQDWVLPNGDATYRRYNKSETEWGEWIETTPNQYKGITESEKQEIINEVVAILGTGGTTPELVNLVTTSIDTDGSIFNGTGFQDGKRFSSSGALKDQTGSTATGFMPCISTEKLKLTGVKFGGTWTGASASNPNVNDGAGGYCYVVLYDSNKTMLSQCSYDTYVSGTNYGIKITHGEDISTTTFDFSGYTGEVQKITYVRINGMGNGADMVVNKI